MKFIFRLLLFIGLTASSFLRAQVLHKFDIFYKVNQSDISWDAEHAIDSVFKKLIEPHSIFYVDIFGYSDSIGSVSSNQKLSEERAKKVEEYFVKYHFQAQRIKYKGLGNSESRAISDSTSKVNYRKVHIEIYLRLPPIAFFNDSLEKFERFNIKSDFGGNIITNSGTRIFIPCNAFVDKAGKAVNGIITIQYREFRDTMDFMARGIPMNNDPYGQFYNSDGMFELRAFSGTTPVYLKLKSEIGVMFTLNRRMPLLDLYFYNDSLKRWVYVMPLTDEDGIVNPDRYSGGGCGGCFNDRVDFSCMNMDRCQSLVFIVNMGLTYSSGEKTISDKLKALSYEQNEIIVPLKTQMDSLSQKMHEIELKIHVKHLELKKVDTLIYKIERVKLSGRKSVFHVRCDALDYNEAMTLSQVNFQINEPLADSVFKVEWDYCRLTSGKGNKYTLTLGVNGNKIKLQELSMKIIKDKTNKTVKKEVYPEYKKILKDRENRIRELRDTLALMNGKLNVMNNKYSELNLAYNAEMAKLYATNNASFKCFWNFSKPYMAPDEKQFTYECWIEYFETNKDLMKKRYEEIKLSSAYKECSRIQEERELYYKTFIKPARTVKKAKVVTYTKPVISTTQPEAMVFPKDTVIVPLEISVLGLYNTAQPLSYSLKKADMSKVDCYLYQKDTINISRIYVLDKRLNSFIEFNGLGKCSPYEFPKLFENIRLIAFDEKGNAYTYLETEKQISRSIELTAVKKISDLEPLFKIHN